MKEHEGFKHPVLTEIEEHAIVISLVENGPKTEEEIIKVLHYFESEKRKAILTTVMLKMIVDKKLRIVSFNDDTKDVTLTKGAALVDNFDNKTI